MDPFVRGRSVLLVPRLNHLLHLVTLNVFRLFRDYFFRRTEVRTGRVFYAVVCRSCFIGVHCTDYSMSLVQGHVNRLHPS